MESTDEHKMELFKRGSKELKAYKVPSKGDKALVIVSICVLYFAFSFVSVALLSCFLCKGEGRGRSLNCTLDW